MMRPAARTGRNGGRPPSAHCAREQALPRPYHKSHDPQRPRGQHDLGAGQDGAPAQRDDRHAQRARPGRRRRADCPPAPGRTPAGRRAGRSPGWPRLRAPHLGTEAGRRTRRHRRGRRFPGVGRGARLPATPSMSMGVRSSMPHPARRPENEAGKRSIESNHPPARSCFSASIVPKRRGRFRPILACRRATTNNRHGSTPAVGRWPSSS
jgi:hypothetical protein